MKPNRLLAFAALAAAATGAGCIAPTDETPDTEPTAEAREAFTIHLYYPDLTVYYQVENNEQGFVVANIGQIGAGAFRVAVLAGAESYSIYESGMGAGAYTWYPAPPLVCGQAITVIADVDNVVAESNENNNAVGFFGWCGL